MTRPSTPYRVNVLGAGVSGLSTALSLLEKDPSRYSVKVISTHLPGEFHVDYTSPWAGAHWRSYADIADKEQQALDAATYKRFVHLADNEPEAGIMYVTGYDYWEIKPKNFVDPWFNTLLKGYRYLNKDELPQGIQFGTTYITVTMNAPKYLQFLQKKFLALGGMLERATLASLKELARYPHDTQGNRPDIIVNCSGLGSRNLLGVHDHQMFPMRGQIVIVKVPDEIWPKAKQFTMERYAEGASMGTGTVTYVIPRDNGEIVLGGTMDRWSYAEAPEEETTKAIVQRVLATRPDLFKDATILRSCVGLRPNRHGGIRVTASVEQLDWNEGWDNPVAVVAHNYGHAGFGYQASYGCAQKTVANIEQSLQGLEQAHKTVRTMSKL
ncbi:hypothetical protein BGW38_003593 [Lunasporangiospora selenospora]|uniref:FAD dependent oxidoreductase domain-containing protein n=1 Tax=Lunasporangiospora selenospora TaxID=979761 RepID=A0A9P6FQY6_9FUNG|nr:hypothetical protein BGW38_003593 [Lunasporangiospora selenospora]